MCSFCIYLPLGYIYEIETFREQCRLVVGHGAMGPRQKKLVCSDKLNESKNRADVLQVCSL